jgi:TH1 protein/WW domain
MNDSTPTSDDHDDEHDTEVQGSQYDWSAFYDDEGRIYYYNSITEESSWDPPSDGLFNPPEEEEQQQQQESDDVIDNNNCDVPQTETIVVKIEDNLNTDTIDMEIEDTTNNNDIPSSMAYEKSADENVESTLHNNESATTTVEMTVPPTGTTTNTTTTTFDWTAYYDEEGRIYYYNSVTDESAWEPPTEGFNPPEGDDDNNVETRNDEMVSDEPLNDDKIKDTELENDVTATTVSLVKKDEHDNGANQALVEQANEETPWVAYEDDEGREYYYNTETGESQWDAPDSFRRITDDNNDTVVETTNNVADGAQLNADIKNNSETSDLLVGHDRIDNSTIHHVDLIKDNLKDASMIADDDDDGDDDDDDIVVDTLDPAVQRLKDAEEAIQSPDSILEPQCMEYVSEIVKADDGNATRAISALIDHYHGQTAICGLLTRWYLDLTKANQQQQPQTSAGPMNNTSIDRTTGIIKSLADNFNDHNADFIRDVIQNVIYKVAKEKYTKESGDNILNLSKSEVTFLEDMMDSTRWRKLLIDLSASHKDSAVLLYCLRAISKRGHHREIAQRINPSEHFTVFNAMLLSELTVVGCQAISAQSDIITATTFNDLVQDILKACTATSYTYLYSVQMLRRLIQMSKSQLSDQTDSNHHHDDDSDIDTPQVRFRRAILKWEALLELLEGSLIDPSNPVLQSESGSSPLLRRRQLDVALTISDLHQRQRKQKRQRMLTTNGTDDNVEVVQESSINQDRLDSALATLLKRHSMGIQIDDSVLNKLLPSGLDVDTYGVGELLIQYPIAVRALLGHLYKPGPTRITSQSTKTKCARLIALSMLAAENSVQTNKKVGKNQTNGSVSTSDIDGDGQGLNELTVTQQIVQGSLYCEQLETMISFLVTTNDTDIAESRKKKSLLTVGEKLCSLALSITPVGLGVAIWAREFTQGKEYAMSASYPTLSLSILSLVRLVAIKHPFARSDTLHVALAFLRHTNSDVSYQKVNSIKECGLRLLMFLMVQGDIVPVLSSLTQRVQQVGSSELDASLIRYFVGGVLDVVRPPVSPMFMRMFGLFLMTPNVIDAVRSAYFAQSNRNRLLTLVNEYYATNNVRTRDESIRDKETLSIVSTLLSTYT